jgi:tRNA 2-thiouridine synthesizing protein A
MDEKLLDTRGLNCPLPVLKARKALMAMQPGQRLRVLTTDPKAPGDFQEFSAATGHTLVSLDEVAGGHAMVLEKRAG